MLQGLRDFIVVESENVLLVCRKSDEQQIRQYVNDVRLEKGEKYVWVGSRIRALSGVEVPGSRESGVNRLR